MTTELDQLHAAMTIASDSLDTYLQARHQYVTLEKPNTSDTLEAKFEFQKELHKLYHAYVQALNTYREAFRDLKHQHSIVVQKKQF